MSRVCVDTAVKQCRSTITAATPLTRMTPLPHDELAIVLNALLSAADLKAPPAHVLPAPCLSPLSRLVLGGGTRVGYLI